MKLKTSAIILIIFFALAGLVIWGYSNNGNTAAGVQGAEPSGAKSALSAPSAFYDFGTISMKNGNVSHDFILANPGREDIVINGIQTSCMCTTALLVEPDGSAKGPFGMPGMGGMTSTNDTVKGGEAKTLRVIFDPNAHGPAGVGEIDRFITVADSSGASLQYEIKATVTP